MANLLRETLYVLEQYDKKPSDVLWVGTLDKYMTWEDFVKKADFDYDDDYGRAEVNEDLMVVGKNWWLERVEYDGSEWWRFKKRVRKPKNYDADIKLEKYDADIRKGWL